MRKHAQRNVSLNLLSLDMEEVNITIIGAGVIGLAIAAGLSERYENIIVLERRGNLIFYARVFFLTFFLKKVICDFNS